MNFRSAPGRFVEWVDTRIEARFSNSWYVDRRFYSDPVLRRIFSLARKFEFKSLLLEIIDGSSCDLLRHENEALKLRRADFDSSQVFRITFWRCAPSSVPSP